MKLTSSDKKVIMQEITKAEAKTTGEIRVHVTYQSKDDQPLEAAIAIFTKLNMHETRERNGVLVYFNPKARKFALYGDLGIYEKLGQTYWNDLVQHVRSTIHDKDLLTGIIDAVQALGEKLAIHFPGSKDDTNELKNDITETH
jgi:uncharacterized membrane protein